MKHLVIEGRRPGGDWGVIDALRQYNPIQHLSDKDQDKFRAEAQEKLHRWANHSSDLKGTFVNWDFRLREVEY